MRLLDEADQQRLLQIARESIQWEMEGGADVHHDEIALTPALDASLANFVTLQLQGDLRGCVGVLEPDGPVAWSVARNARNAAFNDPRFPALTPAELPRVVLDISLLSESVPLHIEDEGSLLKCLRPGADGLILQLGQQRATFLPSVWEQLPRPEAFLRALKIKAGLPGNYWSDQLLFWRYGTMSFSEKDS